MISIEAVHSYAVIAEANGYVIGKSPTAPSPYAVWQVDYGGEGVCCGHYFVDREEAEWDFCARAFEWFEDNMYIHIIEEDKGEPKQPLEQRLISGLKEIRADMTAASQLIDEMCTLVDEIKKEREHSNENNGKDQRH